MKKNLVTCLGLPETRLLSSQSFKLIADGQDLEMEEELRISGYILKAALERYLGACSAVLKCFESGNALGTISQLVTSELQSIASYENTMKHAKSKILRVRNSCTTIVPINSLPPEILARIFRPVVDSERSYYDENEDRTIKLTTKRPEILAHVCSRWYQITVGFYDLWNHIDLVPFCSRDRLVARGYMFAARAGPLALGIRIAGGEYETQSRNPDSDLSAFCASVAPRLSSLELELGYGFDRAYLSALKACLLNCVPGTLDHLTLRGCFAESVPGYYNFIDAVAPSHPSSQVLHIPKRRFEDVLLRVKFLYLRAAYFYWNSKAYHGLVELTLLPQVWHSWASIAESQLVEVLAASPMLREFTFGLGITDIAEDSPPTPVALNELEHLSLCFTQDPQRRALLRIISPGPKPLWVTLGFRGILPPQQDKEFDMFLARANVTTLSIRIKKIGGAGTFPYLPKLLRLSPNLQNLTLHGYSSDRSRASEIDGDEHLPAGLCLNGLTLFNCTVDLAQLEHMAEIFPIHTLRPADDCRFLVRWMYRSPHDCQSELCEIFPVVESISRWGFSDHLGLDG